MKDRTGVRNLNRYDILSLIKRGACRSQAELAEATSLRPSTVSYAIRDLQELNLVRSEGRLSTGPAGGKRRTLLGLNPAAGSFIGLMVRKTRCDVLIRDFVGSTVGTAHYPLNTPSHSDALIAELVAIISKHIPSRLLGIGMAIASVVQKDGSIAPSADFPTPLPTPGAMLSRLMSDKLAYPVPVVVENDANCVALHGYQQDHTSHTLSFVLSSDPITIGSGLVIDGTIYRGASGGAGEVLSSRMTHALEETELDDELINAIIRFTDPDLVILAKDRDTGPWTGIDAALTELQNHRTKTVTNPDATLSGIIQLTWERTVTRLLEEKR